MLAKFNPVRAIRKRLQRSIQTKLAFVLLLVGFLSLSTLGLLAVWLSYHEVRNEVSKRNQEVAVLVSSQVDSYLDNIVADLNFAARTLLVVGERPDVDPAPIFRLVKNASDQTYQSMAWIDKNGIRRAFYRGSLLAMEGPGPAKDMSGYDQTSLNMANDPAFLATQAGKTYYSKIYFSPTKDPLMLVAIPVRDNNKTFQGSLVVETNLRHTIEIVSSLKTDRTINALVIDDTKTVLASSRQANLGTLITNPQLTRLMNGTKGTAEYNNEQGESYLVGYAPLTGRAGWSVLVSQASGEALSGINRLALVALGVIVVAAVLISFIAVLLSKTITRPLRELAFAANRITTTGSLDEQIPITSQDEVGELSASFNGMILALRKTRLALEHWNRELEHKVEIRTLELTRTNEKLENINGQLERANLHKSQFLANMSHELRTPLNAIIGFSEVLQDRIFGELNERQLRYVNNILSSGRHLLSLVNDVLDLSKVEAGRMELHHEEFSSRMSLAEVITQLSTLAAQKELKVYYEVSPGLDLVSADRGRFRQILYNLVSNAIKFTPQGGEVRITGRLEGDSEGFNNGVALFEVRDTGIGIEAEHLDMIFESFHQVDNSYSRQYQGTGLGLALSRKLVEMHGGKIWVNSTPGVGSTFGFTLPVVNPAPVAVFSDLGPTTERGLTALR